LGRGQASRSETPPAARARTHRGRIVAGLATIAALAGLAVLASRAPRPALVKRDPGLSVLVVSVDTLRADALGCYGRRDAQTPWIDRLAAEGVRFETARAHNVVTLPSHANLLSGQYPLRHGVRDNTGFRFPAERATLATILRERGWQTGAFVSAFPLDSRFGLDRGFDVYDDRLGGTETAGAFAMPERAGTETVRAALRWIDSVRGQRWFAFVHLYEPHFPYEPPAPLASSFPAEPYQGRSSSRSSRRAGVGGRSSSSRPTTASRSESTARRLTASSPTRRPCACHSFSARRGCCPRGSSALPSDTSTWSRPSSTSWGSRRPATCRGGASCR